MLRFGYLVMLGSFVACSLFACGDKLNPKGNAPTGSGGTTGEGGTTEIGEFDGGESEAGVAIDGVVGAGGATGGTGGLSGAGGSTTAVVSYKNTIAPIMAKSCATSSMCHATGNPWSVDLDTYAGVKSNAAASINAIEGGTMPPSGTISAADLKSLQDWVNTGSPNN